MEGDEGLRLLDMPRIPEEVWEELERLRAFQNALTGALLGVDMRAREKGARTLAGYTAEEIREKEKNAQDNGE